MTNWVRLWEDMPTDPKWRVIAKRANCTISEVIAVFNFMLVNAACSKHRGRLQNWSDEDVGAALDMDQNAIERIRTHMNGKVLDGDNLSGWERRQPKREDGGADRARAWREAQKQKVTEEERNRTQSNATERPDTDTDTDNNILLPLSDEPKEAKPKRVKNEYPEDFERFWRDYPRSPNMSKPQALKEWKKLGPDDRDAAIRSLPAFKSWIRTQPNYSPIYAERYLSYRRFEGHAKTGEVISTSFVVVQQHSPEGQAWEQYNRQTKGKGVPWTNGIWRFPTQFPPEMRAAE